MPSPTIQSNIRAPGSYNIVDASGANNKLPAYRQPLNIVAPRIKAPSVWAATGAITLGAKVKPTTANADGYYYICITAGTTGASEPTWPGAGGSVTDGTVVWRELCNAQDIIAVNTPTRVFSPDDGARLGGSGSLAHRMVRAALRQYQYAECSVTLVDDHASAVHSTCTITFSGTANNSGSAEIRGMGKERVLFSWATGATAAEIAAGFDTAIAAMHDLPATPSVASAVLTLLAKNGGEPGNELGKYNPTNTDYNVSVTFTTGTGISAAITAWASGANNPDITDALTAATAGAYALFAMPFKDATNIAALRAHLLSVSNEVNCNGARAWVGITSTIAGASTLAVENDERLHVAFARQIYFTSFEIAAAVAAEHMATGHPAIPLNNRPLRDCDGADISAQFEFNELNALLWAGVTPLNTDGAGAVRIERSITTYVKNEAGSDDETYLDTTVIANADYCRKSTRQHDLVKYAGKVLRDNHVPGEPAFVVTPEDINSDHLALFYELEKYGVCQNVALLKPRFVTTRDGNVAGRVNSDIPVEVVQGLHILANYFRLTTAVQR